MADEREKTEEDTPSILGNDSLSWWRPRPRLIVSNGPLKIVERKRPRLWRPEGPEAA
jgi:hypothetical protein